MSIRMAMNCKTEKGSRTSLRSATRRGKGYKENNIAGRAKHLPGTYMSELVTATLRFVGTTGTTEQRGFMSGFLLLIYGELHVAAGFQDTQATACQRGNFKLTSCNLSQYI